MKVECLVENIEKQISLLSKIVPTHAQVPIISNILIEATSEGLFLSATDLELGIKIKIPAKVEETGATTVPGKQFIEAISSLPKDKVSFSLEKDIFIISSRDNKIAFQTISKEEFPNLFEKKGEKVASFVKDEFAKIFSKLIFAASIDETRPVLTGIFISQREEGIDFVATDGFRLSLKKTNDKILEESTEKMILSARLINEVMLLKAEKLIEMYVLKEGNQVLFETDNIVLVGRLIEGDFPNYERIIPTSFKTKIVIDKEEFLQAIRLASVFAKESANIVKVKIEDEALKIFSRASGVGEGDIKVEIEKEGEDNEISYNIKFLHDFLKNADSKQIVMELNSNLEPGVFRIESDPTFLHIIMPVRVQE